MPRKEPTPCSKTGCANPSRARGLCENHYRQELNRERGAGGIAPKDDTVYKVRVRTPNGSQPYYYSDPDKAASFVAEAKSRGTLQYFAEYTLTRKIVG